MDFKHFFVVAGGQRCGSSYLTQLLDEHPEIALAKPIKPEPKIFFKRNKVNDKFLKSFFSDRNHEFQDVIGEKSTSYLECPLVPNRIKNYYENTKILIILRNPFDRAISNYKFSVENGLETRTLEEAFIYNFPAPTLQRVTSVSPFDYLERSRYLKYLKNYYQVFHHTQIKVLIYEEFVNNIEKLNEVYRFLGCSYFKPYSLSKVINKGENFKIDQNSLKTVKDYYFEYFYDEIQYLEDYLNKDLSIWKKILKIGE